MHIFREIHIMIKHFIFSSQIKFDMIKSNNTLMPVLHNLLNNGRGLSLFFHGIGNRVSTDG